MSCTDIDCRPPEAPTLKLPATRLPARHPVPVTLELGIGYPARMDSLETLIDTKDPAWPLLQEWLEDGEGRVEVLPRDPATSEATLLHLQTSTQSVLGALAWETGGLLIDHRVRVLGGGTASVKASLRTWNGGGAEGFAVERGLIRVGFDVFGGVFALNGGALGPADGIVHYFAPDALAWESLRVGHSAWLHWLMSEEDQVATFYAPFTWPGVEEDLARLAFDDAVAFSPGPWTKEGADLTAVTRTVVPARELVSQLMEASKRLHAR